LKNKAVFRSIHVLGTIVHVLGTIVYTLAQRILRHRIKELNTTLPNQLDKPTERPTIRWVFQIFEGIHVLFLTTEQSSQELVLNLSSLRMRILEVLGPPFQKIYENAA